MQRKETGLRPLAEHVDDFIPASLRLLATHAGADAGARLFRAGHAAGLAIARANAHPHHHQPNTNNTHNNHNKKKQNKKQTIKHKEQTHN